MIRFSTLAASLLMSGLAGLAATASAAVLEIAGSTTVQKAIVDPVSPKARDSGMELKMLPVGTGKGLQMLAEGKVAVAAVSDTLPDAVNAAKKAGLATAPANLKMHTVVTDKLTPITHPANGVKALSKEQLKAIFSGKVKNWKEVGGADAPIVVVVPVAGSGTRGLIDKQILDGAALAADAKQLVTSSAEVDEVARERNAIGYVGEGTATAGKNKVRTVQGPEVSRPLGFVTVGEPTAEVRKLLDFLQTADAKKLFVQ
jgi:phosphate transport system substrate-binding protein